MCIKVWETYPPADDGASGFPALYDEMCDWANRTLENPNQLIGVSVLRRNLGAPGDESPLLGTIVYFASPRNGRPQRAAARLGAFDVRVARTALDEGLYVLRSRGRTRTCLGALVDNDAVLTAGVAAVTPRTTWRLRRVLEGAHEADDFGGHYLLENKATGRCLAAAATDARAAQVFSGGLRVDQVACAEDDAIAHAQQWSLEAVDGAPAAWALRSRLRGQLLHFTPDLPEDDATDAVKADDAAPAALVVDGHTPEYNGMYARASALWNDAPHYVGPAAPSRMASTVRLRFPDGVRGGDPNDAAQLESVAFFGVAGARLEPKTFARADASALIFAFSAPVAIASYSWTTSQHANTRDPARWQLEACDGAEGWAVIHDSADAAVPVERGACVGPFKLEQFSVTARAVLYYCLPNDETADDEAGWQFHIGDNADFDEGAADLRDGGRLAASAARVRCPPLGLQLPLLCDDGAATRLSTLPAVQTAAKAPSASSGADWELWRTNVGGLSGRYALTLKMPDDAARRLHLNALPEVVDDKTDDGGGSPPPSADTEGGSNNATAGVPAALRFAVASDARDAAKAPSIRRFLGELDGACFTIDTTHKHDSRPTYKAVRSFDGRRWVLYYADDTALSVHERRCPEGGAVGWWLATEVGAPDHTGAILYGPGDHASPDGVPHWVDCSLCVLALKEDGRQLFVDEADGSVGVAYVGAGIPYNSESDKSVWQRNEAAERRLWVVDRAAGTITSLKSERRLAPYLTNDVADDAVWKIRSDGTVVLSDASERQLYAMPSGWANVGEQDRSTNNNPKRREWRIVPLAACAGITLSSRAAAAVGMTPMPQHIFLGDGRQLFVSKDGYAGVASPGLGASLRSWRGVARARVIFV